MMDQYEQGSIVYLWINLRYFVHTSLSECKKSSAGQHNNSLLKVKKNCKEKLNFFQFFGPDEDKVVLKY